MRAVRLVQVGKPFEESDIPIPEIGSSDILIRVAAAASVTRMRIIARTFPKLIVYR
jgi:NADPH:quinone reductase-like Zn-dependent oxidoreductase